MVRFRTFALLCALAVGAANGAARAEDASSVMNTFFSTWDDNAKVTPQAVQSLYANRVVYYGQSLTTAQVYANKIAFIRRWPSRRYQVVPGSVAKTCDDAKTRCNIGVTLAYRTSSQARDARTSGLTRVSLILVREDGQLKIARESGRPVSRAGL